jgi:hypothetical protein
MNKFRKLGFIEYNRTLEVHNSLFLAQRRAARQSSPQEPCRKGRMTLMILLELLERPEGQREVKVF